MEHPYSRPDDPETHLKRAHPEVEEMDPGWEHNPHIAHEALHNMANAKRDEHLDSYVTTVDTIDHLIRDHAKSISDIPAVHGRALRMVVTQMHREAHHLVEADEDDLGIVMVVVDLSGPSSPPQGVDVDLVEEWMARDHTECEKVGVCQHADEFARIQVARDEMRHL